MTGLLSVMVVSVIATTVVLGQYKSIETEVLAEVNCGLTVMEETDANAVTVAPVGTLHPVLPLEHLTEAPIIQEPSLCAVAGVKATVPELATHEAEANDPVIGVSVVAPYDIPCPVLKVRGATELPTAAAVAVVTDPVAVFMIV